jgi:hypothetical protein
MASQAARRGGAMRPPSSGVRTAAARPPAASFLLATAATAALVGGFYFWLVVSSFRLPDSGAVGCRPDGEGSWAVGMFYGSSPLALRPIELVRRRAALTAQLKNSSFRASLWCVSRLTPRVLTLVWGVILVARKGGAMATARRGRWRTPS